MESNVVMESCYGAEQSSSDLYNLYQENCKEPHGFIKKVVLECYYQIVSWS